LGKSRTKATKEVAWFRFVGDIEERGMCECIVSIEKKGGTETVQGVKERSAIFPKCNPEGVDNVSR